MIVRLYIVARLMTLICATWILLLAFLSFASIHLWTPPYLPLALLGSALAQLGLWLVYRRMRAR